MQKRKRGKVYIVGGGPGDPGLITVKGLKIVRSADVILYDFLSPLALLKEAKPDTELVCVGKSGGFHLREQEEINEILLNKAKEKKIVVRLKGGDPFLFSRGIEEWRFLRGHGVSVEVVPGVTSAIAAPESFGIPLTLKDEITSVGIIAGRRVDPDAEIEAPMCGTLIYLMAVANIENVVKALRRSGRSLQEPCAFIERGTRPQARVVFSTLKNAAKDVINNNIKPPAVFIVGPVIDRAMEKRCKNVRTKC